MKQRRTYIRSIDAVFGNTDAYSEVSELIDSGWLERRDQRLAFGSACGDVVGLSIERETISWAVLGPRGAIASQTIDAPVAPIAKEPASSRELERILTAALQEISARLPDRPIAGIGVAWPAAIGLDGEPYGDGFSSSGSDNGERLSPRKLVSNAMFGAGMRLRDRGEGGGIEVVNDADADLLFDARWGVGRDVGNLLGVKIGGGLGLSLTHEGRLVRGHAGRAGQIEHIKVRYEDFLLPDQWNNVRELDELAPCSCNGSNCIARFATGKTIVDQLRDYDEPKLSYNQRGRAVEEDPLRDVVTAVFGRAGRLLGQALLGPVLAFDPERIIISAFPKNASLLQALRGSLIDGTRVHLDPAEIIFSSAKRQRTAAGAGLVVIEQAVIPWMEEVLTNSASRMRRYELPYWLRAQVSREEQDVSPYGPRYSHI